MRWSKLKQLAEARFADGVRGRVELWTTRYNYQFSVLNGPETRGWITIDGREIINMHRHLSVNGVHTWDERRFAVGIYDSWDLKAAAEKMLTLSIGDTFATPDTLVRALAMLDRRAGRRRLAEFNPAAEVPLVATLLAFRRQATARANRPTVKHAAVPPD